MVPAEFIFLDRLPLNPNGKVAYDQLPAPRRRGVANAPFESPNSAVENRLAAIFTAVLGVQRIGRRDDFFQLGGHSLLAAQAAARIRETFAVNLDLRTFLTAPTVAALASHLDAVAARPAAQSETNSLREELEI
jgi:acyl carrier protein